MSVWRECQEACYQRFTDGWMEAGLPVTPFLLDNESIDPPGGPWAYVSVRRRPGGPGTIGQPGNRKMDRAGVVYIDLREPPGGGVGTLSDLSARAAAIFENCRFGPHDMRFANVDVGEEGQIETGRWWGCTVEARFEYEEMK